MRLACCPFRLSSHKRTKALECYQRKSPRIFADLTVYQIFLFFMGKISTGKLYVKHRHKTYACCLSPEKPGFMIHCFYSPFRNISETYTQAIQTQGVGKEILYIFPQIQPSCRSNFSPVVIYLQSEDVPLSFLIEQACWQQILPALF